MSTGLMARIAGAAKAPNDQLQTQAEEGIGAIAALVNAKNFAEGQVQELTRLLQERTIQCQHLTQRNNQLQIERDWYHRQVARVHAMAQAAHRGTAEVLHELVKPVQSQEQAETEVLAAKFAPNKEERK